MFAIFKDQVTSLLQKYLGKYVRDISQEALSLSVWQGDLELTNMQLKPEALNALNLPIRVKAGFLGSVTIKVPWTKLGSEPVVVLLDRIFVLAEPQTDVVCSTDYIDNQEAKRKKIKETEIALLDAKLGENDNTPRVNNSWLASCINTIIGNLKLSITNIHVRYEDSQSNSGHPFAIGLTLKKLAAVTVDDSGKETFIPRAPLDSIHKAGELEGLALYLDPECKSWNPKQPWENLSPSQWSELFEPHIEAYPGSNNSAAESKCHYLLQPVGGSANYRKLGSGDPRTADKEMQKAVFKLHDVTLSVSQTQYQDMLKLAENFSSYRKRQQYAGFRPARKVNEDAKSWWKYAYRVTVDQITKASGRFSWKRIVRFARLRKKYLSIYIKCLQSNPKLVTCHENKEIQELESDLDVDVAVQWRMLAHSYVDRSRHDEDGRRKQSTGGWWSFLWGSQSSDDPNEPRAFTEEDWQQINQVIGYEEGKESSILPGHDPPDMLHTVLEIQMEHNATKILDENCRNIIVLSAEDMKCSAKIYGEMKIIDFKLGSYQVSSPEGLLAESEAQKEAVGGQFILQPLGKNLDWSLCAKASPCYISYLKASIDEVIHFFQNRDAISQTIALEAAAALQATFDEMARNAQQQLNEALKQKPRFSVQLDIAAPKIIILSDFYPDGKQQSKLLLDLGHLTLQTEEAKVAESNEGIDLYICFKLSLTDVQAFLVDGIFDWREHYYVSNGSTGDKKFQASNSYLPVLEKCGITMALQQIYVPHPDYPATRISVRLPSLGFHLSPARFHRLMQILKVFQDSSSDEQGSLFRPWDPADFEGEVSVLVWKGVGNREAVWQQQYAALAGPFLYILESSSASVSKRRLGLFGKQVHLVSPEYIGGVQNVLAVCDAGSFNSKMMESLSTLLLRFGSDESLETWKGRIQGAIYQSSSPVAVSGTLASEINQASEKEAYRSTVLDSSEKEVFFLVGALDELKIVISSGPIGIQKSKEHLLLVTEKPLLELRASGSKVEFSMRKHDMAIGAILQSLEVEDKYFRKGDSKHYYLACSDIVEPKLDEGISEAGNSSEHMKDETFFDSQGELGEGVLQCRNRSGSMSVFYDATELDPEELSLTDPPDFVRIPTLLPDPSGPYEKYPEDKRQESFVKAQVTLFSLDSPAYRHIDKQIMVSLATLRFFCIRPTIMALLNFTDAITTDILEPTPREDSMSTKPITDDNEASQPLLDHKDSIVKGLLGSGKERTLFSLMLNMHHAVFILNADNGSQIASLAQENMNCNIKVFPSSFSVSAALGNLRISDGSLDAKHPYNFICNTRNPESSSFVEMEFCSFNKDDNDYEGYEYSLVGKFSEIRFVYLNRFIQEISAYFMGLAPQNAGNIVKVNNKGTDVEKIFTQSEVEGSPAIKFDISLTKPILIMPRDTNSIDFLELDVLHIKVTNFVRWIGGGQADSTAVRLDTITLHIEDIHLYVGLHGTSGQGIIKKANGLSLTVTRSLRDLWHQVPAIDASVKIEELKADISDKEYEVITECALSNISEKANLPPAILLPDSDSITVKEQRMEVNTQVTGTEIEEKGEFSRENSRDVIWTTITVTVEVNLVELSLFKGTAREQQLATAQLNGVWIAFQSNSIDESDIMASLNSLTLKDDREGTDPVLAYMIGKSEDMEYHVKDQLSEEVILFGSFGNVESASPMSMLVIDAKLSSTMQMVSLRIQQLKLLVAVDFLLAIAEFFVPSLLSKGFDSKEQEEDLADFQVGVYLDQPMFRQANREMFLSPRRPLIVDCFSIDEYIYDGGGGFICLQNEDGETLKEMPSGPCILIGSGKYIRFKNVTIKSGELLDSCILLGSKSRYSVLESDGVFLLPLSPISNDEPNIQKAVQMEQYPPREMMFDLQAIGLELTFYDSGSQFQMVQMIERLIRAKVDVFSRFSLKGSDMELNAKLRSLSLDASSGLRVIEPVDAEVNYSSVSGKQEFHIMLSNLFANLSFSVLQLILRLQEDISSFLRITARQTTIRCYQFDKIWTGESSSRDQNVTFWRARPPPGFAILGDCITPSDEPLSKGVLAVNMSLGWFKRPTDFEKVWSSEGGDSVTGCSIWKPICPTGYVSLGCVAMQGVDPPPRSSVACVKERVVTSSSWMDCILFESNAYASFWRVDNSVGSFFVEHGMEVPHKDFPFELLYVASDQGFPRAQKIDHRPELITNEQHVNNTEQELSSNLSQPRVGQLYETLSEFERVWSNGSNDSTGQISIWRPVLPQGCTFVGDLAVQGCDPPNEGIILRSEHDDVLLRKPLYFKELAHIPKRKGFSEVYFWLPIPPAGYAALGCICSKSSRLDLELIQSVRCIRNDIVVPVQYGAKFGEGIEFRDASQVVNIWPVKNKMGTFIAQKGLKKPPKRLSLCLAELDRDDCVNNIVADAELEMFSAVVYDDFCGLMTPILNVSLSGVKASAHGHSRSLRSSINFEVAAETYNTKYLAWEPLIEPFNAIIRYKYQSFPSHTSISTMSQIRFVSISSFNINASVTNLNMLLEAYESWNNLSKQMEHSKNDAMGPRSPSDCLERSVLDFGKKKTFKVIHHNKLGEDLLIRYMETNGQPKTVTLTSGGTTSLNLPTPSSILDPRWKGNLKKSMVKVITVFLGSAKILHLNGLTRQNYMATLRIFPKDQSSDISQLNVQSAHTRFVHPELISNSDSQVLCWNEAFIFKLEEGENYMAEITVTEISSGSALGSCLVHLSVNEQTKFSVKNEGSSSICMIGMKWDPLLQYDKQQEKVIRCRSGELYYGVHTLSIAHGEEIKRISHQKHSSLLEQGAVLLPWTIQVSYKDKESWIQIGLNYAASATCWRLCSDTILTEADVNDMEKQLMFRSLAVVTNATEFPLDLALSSNEHENQITALDQVTSKMEEVYENERYQPLLGWGSTWPGHLLPTDPQHWSKRDGSCSRKEFPEVPLPEGWQWQDNWKVDMIGAADENGWSYAFDFSTQDWPPLNNHKGSTKFVRRRRWIRSCKYVSPRSSATPLLIGTVGPGETNPLPVWCLRPDSPDHILTFRPEEKEKDGKNKYRWSNTVLSKMPSEIVKKDSISGISLHSLIELEALICSSVEEGTSSEPSRSIWFVVDVKARERGISSQLDPLQDWQISVMAPLILHNYLPVLSEYSVLEKCEGKGFVLRQNGIIEPGKEAHIYTADIRKAIYLTWIPQGGWQPEEAPALICHPNKPVVKHILLENFSTRRLLRVLVDDCSDAKEFSAKRLRFYVPCWLDVKKLPPLRCVFSEPINRKNWLFESKSSLDKEIEVIEHEEVTGPYVMVSNLSLEKMGISVDLSGTDKVFIGDPKPLKPLSQADGFVELIALDNVSSVSYKIFASLKLCPYPSVLTKVLMLRPYVTFTNRLGEVIFLKQTTVDEPKKLHPFDYRVIFPCPQTEGSEGLQVSLDGLNWSLPLVMQEETLQIPMWKTTIRIEIRGYEEGSRFLVVFRRGSSSGPYRMENHLRSTEVKYRQTKVSDDLWESLQPGSTNLYTWENPHEEQLLEVSKLENGILSSAEFDINKFGNHRNDNLSNFCCRVLKVSDNLKVVRFCELNETLEVAESSSYGENSFSQMSIELEVKQLGISVIDLRLHEILYLCMDGISFRYTTEYASKADRFTLLLGNLQLDNQLPMTVLPVLFAPEGNHDLANPVLQISFEVCGSNSETTAEVYPYIRVEVTRHSWRINIHEPIIWAVLDFYKDLRLDKISAGSEIGQVDPEVRIEYMSISETRLRLTLETAPRQRPRGKLGIWSPFITALGNTSKMPIHLRAIIRKNRHMHKSAITPAILDRLRRDLIHNPLMLLTGLDVLGMTSSTLATLSGTVAELSSDGRFLQLRSKQDRSRRIAGVGDGLVQGTEAIAQGVAFGVSGMISKPIENAKEKGLLGFIQGLGKAAVGVVIQPVSGVLDFVSLTVNGVGASYTRFVEIFQEKPAYDRIRPPRSVSPDGILHSYDEKAAKGQLIMQLAEGRGGLVQGMLFREASKFAWSDMYEDHFYITNQKIIMVTTKRVILLQCTETSKNSFILWDVQWEDLLALEMACSGSPGAPIYAVLHLRGATASHVHLVRCSSNSSEDEYEYTRLILGSISRSWEKYRPTREALRQELVTKHQHRVSSRPSTSNRVIRSGHRSENSEQDESNEAILPTSSSEKTAGKIVSHETGSTKQVFNFVEIWTSEQKNDASCCVDTVSSKGSIVTIWRPIVPEGYISVGDIAHIGRHPPLLAFSYINKPGMFAHPTGFDLVWRSWKEGFLSPVSIWAPKAPRGYTALGCIAIAEFIEPDIGDVWCAHSSLVEDSQFEDEEVWHAPATSAWDCFFYQVANEALTFMAVRRPQQKAQMKPKKVLPDRLSSPI